MDLITSDIASDAADTRTCLALPRKTRPPAILDRIEVTAIGVHVVHDQRFLIDRPSGTGDYLFLHFLTPIEIRDRDGVAVHPADSCMLYAPGAHQWYRNTASGFDHHWFHFGGASADALVGHYGVPTNTVFRPWRVDFIPALLADLKRERSRAENFWNEAAAALTAQVLLNLARHAVRPDEDALTPHLGELRDRFRDLRVRVHDELHRHWTVADLASQVHLSESRFARLYAEFFTVSPVEDLIQARITKARWLLTNTTLAIKQVAEQSGFPNIAYFSRLFHRRVGCAPRDYYRRFVAGVVRNPPPSPLAYPGAQRMAAN
jgi:AraC-like DNA-binding protein